MCCMLHHDHEERPSSDGHRPAPAVWYKSARGVTLAVFSALVVYSLWYFLWTDHRAHVLAFLPYVIFLLCPLMHLLHRHGHQHHKVNTSNFFRMRL
jgi:hypothetical protein